MDLTGKCLIARPNVQDPMFAKSVVYVYEHTSKGVAGVILNKKTAGTTRDLCMNRGFDAPVPIEPLFAGGPVNERAVIMFHTADWMSSNTLNVKNNLCVTSDDMMLYRYTQGDTPRYYRFVTGASVWHPQQIKAEMSRNNWLIAELDILTLFETDHRALWDVAVETAAQETMDKFI